MPSYWAHSYFRYGSGVGKGADSPCMRPIAERLVGRPSATAQGHAISNLIGFSVGLNNGNASPHPDRSANFFRRIFYQRYRWLEFWFKGFPTLFVPRDRPPCRTTPNLMFHELAGFSVIRLLNEVPNPTFRIAEPGERAKVRQRLRRQRSSSDLHYQLPL
jgi:hypothetical protein